MKNRNREAMAERYIYDVTRRLPQHQKEDISRELHSLIDDMLEERGGETASEQDLRAVLTKLGDPKKLADQYREKKRYLIGPAYFEQYTLVLKIVLPCVLFGITVAEMLTTAITASTNYVSVFTNYFVSVFSSLFQGFTWVTIIFAIIEYHEEKTPGETVRQKGWNPDDLPEIPSEHAMIPKSEPIVGLVFTILAMILFNGAPQLMSVYSTANGFSAVPIFDLQVLKTMLPLFNLCFVTGAVREIFKLLFGRYSIKLAVIILATNLLTVCLTVAIFSSGAVWNPNLPQLLGNVLLNDFDIYPIWNNIGRIFIAIVVFASILDSAVSFFKGFKADRPQVAASLS